MAKRTVALCQGELIGIESIYTGVDGKQINIPEKVEELRRKSRANELKCPCGCGSTLVLVASDKGLREQHFRLKNDFKRPNCVAVDETDESITSKIILKCWLEDKLQTDDLKTRVPVNSVNEEVESKYEYTVLSKSRKLGISYLRERRNILDEKLDVLARNQSVNTVYIVDDKQFGNTGQYPEYLIKFQQQQKYSLFLRINSNMYTDAEMYVTIYRENYDRTWESIVVADGMLSDFSFDEENAITFKGECLLKLIQKAESDFAEELKLKKELALQGKKEEEEARKKAYEDSLLTCEECGFVGTEDDFQSYTRDTKTGRCYGCVEKARNKAKARASNTRLNEFRSAQNNKNKAQLKEECFTQCPHCNNKLVKRTNGKTGEPFVGCSNFPKCTYTRSWDKNFENYLNK